MGTYALNAAWQTGSGKGQGFSPYQDGGNGIYSQTYRLASLRERIAMEYGRELFKLVDFDGHVHIVCAKCGQKIDRLSAGMVEVNGVKIEEAITTHLPNC